MRDWQTLLSGALLLLATSVGLGFLLHRVKKPARPLLSEGANVKLYTDRAAFRSRIQRIDEAGIWVSAPLLAGNYVALRPEETVRVEVACIGSVCYFRTEIAERDLENHEFLLAWPKDYWTENRRAENRQYFSPPAEVELNGQVASLLNISDGGAKMLTFQSLATGEMVRVHLPERNEDLLAYVLEVTPDVLDGRQATAARVVFSA